jgi:hypothetical protein
VVSCLAAHAVQALAQADIARLMASLDAITGGDDAAARRNAIVAQLKALDIQPTIEPFGEGRTAGANIVVTLGNGEKTILIGAHYDRVSVGRGAVDNGANGDAIFAAVSHETGLLLRSLRAAGEAARLSVRDVPPTRYPGSDHLTMVGAGIETLGLALIDADEIDAVIAAVTDKTAGKAPRVLRLIHSPNDTLAEVRPEQMIRGIAVVEDLLRRVDRGE